MLKTAYELACKRIIPSNYAIQQEKERIMELRRIAELPDFVAEWEKSQDSFNYPSQDIEEKMEINSSPTKLFTKEELNKREEFVTKEEAQRLDEIKEQQIMQQNKLNQLKEEENIPELHWYGHFTSYGGFSRMNRAFVFGLSNRGVKVKIDIQPISVDINQATQDELEILSNVEINPKAPKVFGATIPLNMNHNGKKIIFTMMENSETLHKGYVERLNLFDEIWVPTNFGANQFVKNGVTRPIFVMPLGVDIDRYKPETKISPKSLGFDLNGFVFLSMFKWSYRKGFDVLLKAYMDEFSSEDDVSLLLVTRCETDNNPNRISDDVSIIRSGIDKTEALLPHVSIYTKKISEKNMPKVYNMGDAYVLISRGEGFNLTVCEAAACGLPVISSNCSGHSDFLNNNNSFLVDPDEMVKVSTNGRLSKIAKHCGFYEDQIFPDFGEKAIRKTRELMRHMYNNYNEALEKSQNLTSLVHEEYSWDMAIDRVLKRIKEIK